MLPQQSRSAFACWFLFQWHLARVVGQGFDHTVVAATLPSAATCVTRDAHACLEKPSRAADHAESCVEIFQWAHFLCSDSTLALNACWGRAHVAAADKAVVPIAS